MYEAFPRYGASLKSIHECFSGNSHEYESVVEHIVATNCGCLSYFVLFLVLLSDLVGPVWQCNHFAGRKLVALRFFDL